MPKLPVNPNHDSIAESALLGGMLLGSDEAIQTASFYVRPEDIAHPVLREAFEAIQRLHRRGDPVGIPSVTLEMMTHPRDSREGIDDFRRVADHLIGVQCSAALEDAINTIASPANAKYWAERVVECADRRKLLEASQQVIAARGNSPEQIAELEAALRAMSAAKHGRDRPVGEILADRYDTLERQSRGELRPRRVFTGLRMLDEAGGLAAPEFWIFAARPRVGKSVLGWQIASFSAQHELDEARAEGRRPRIVLFFSLEMGDGELADRTFAREAGVPARRLRMADVDDDDWSPMARTVAGNEELPLRVVSDGRLDIRAIVSTCERIAMGSEVALVVVDHITIVRPSNPREPREQQVSGISAEMKGLAMSLGAPVVGLCQLNRKVEAREDGIPMLSDLRDSGSLEQDANAIGFLHRPVLSNPGADPHEASLIMAKVRHGEPTTIPLRFDGAGSKFEDVDGGGHAHR